jgi:hypothetical protein
LRRYTLDGYGQAMFDSLDIVGLDKQPQQAGAYTGPHLCSTWVVFITDTSKAPHLMGQKCSR